jgi:DNA repair protein RadD
MKELRPHQVEALEKLRQSVGRRLTKPVLQASTGFGKTVVAAHIIASARAKGKRVLFVVPAISLVNQSLRAFWDEGIREIAAMQSTHEMTDASQPVQVASVQTLAKRTIDKPDLIIVDECHRVFEVIKTMMEEWPDVPFIGLSATPWTKGLGRLYDNLIVSATTQDLINTGFLSPFRVFAPSHPDLTGVKVARGDYVEGELSEAMQKGTLTGDIVSTWLERGQGRPTLCFGVDRAHAMALHEGFEKQGVRSAYQDAQTTDVEREAIRKGFAAGEIQVVCNIGTLTTGVDWDVRCIILARPTKSEILYVQIIGRGLRTAPGKQDLIILDHSDTTLNLGFVTDIRHERLCDGVMASKADAPEPRLPRACPACTAIFPKFARICPECKFEPKIQSKAMDTEDGQLVELDGKKGKRPATMDEKVAFMSQLKAFQIETGKSDGFISNKFRAKFGTWPNDPRLRNAYPADEVNPAVRSWLKSQAIRYAKAMDARRPQA